MSCLVSKFQYYVDLNERDIELLTSMEKEIKTYKKRAQIYEQDESTENIYVVKSGWCASFSQFADGGRLILNIHFPGDLIGTTTLPFKNSVCGLMAVTEVEVCPFPKAGVKKILGESPKIAALLYAMGMQENVVLIDRLKAMGRMTGDNRVAQLLLQIWTRLKITNCDTTNSFDMPISQELLGDALGLTTVYVNKMLKQLQDEGYISMNNKKVTLTKADALSKRCDFNDRYYKLDTSWYPE